MSENANAVREMLKLAAVQCHAYEQRERIATACLAGMLADPEFDVSARAAAQAAIHFADALIDALNKPGADGAEGAEG